MTGEQKQKLYDALLSAFHDPGELERFVAFRLDQELKTIAGSGPFGDVVFALIQWAESSGQTEKLVRCAVEARSQNPRLQEFVALYFPALKAPPNVAKPAAAGAALPGPAPAPPNTPPKILDPAQMIDRDAEQALFRELLLFKDDARLLTVQDGGGRGKSSLLRRLRYNCKYDYAPAVPVTLIALDQLADNSPIALVDAIRRDLDEPNPDLELTFPRFDALNAARLQFNFAPFAAGGAPLPNGAPIPTSWASPNQEDVARRGTIRGFFEDLRQICDQTPVVLLFDTYEKANPELAEWLLTWLIRPHCFDLENRPPRLVVVLAGRLLPNFKTMGFLAGGKYQRLVKSIESLGAWEDQHVRDFLKVHGYENFTDDEIHVICSRLASGKLSLSDVLKTAEIWSGAA